MDGSLQPLPAFSPILSGNGPTSVSAFAEARFAAIMSRRTTRSSARISTASPAAGTKYRWFIGCALPVRDASERVVRWFGTCTDIHEAKRAEAELRRANADLEQFAYSASHDLREPLRIVAIYSQLLERKYGGQLDDLAKEYLTFTVDGTRRMEALVADLLAYTEAVGMTDGRVSPFSAETVLDQALTNLKGAIEESAAVVRRNFRAGRGTPRNYWAGAIARR